MKYIWLLSILFFTNISWGWAYEFKPKNKYNGLDLYEISQELKKNSFFEMDLTRAGRIPAVHFDQLFFNSADTNVYAAVVFDLIAPPSEKNLVLENSQIVCHAKTTSGRDFALYFSNLKYAAQISFCNTHTTTTLKKLIIQTLVPSAFAEDCRSYTSILTKNIAQSRQAVTAGSEWLLQKLGTCTVQAMQGGLGAAEGFGKGIVSLLSNPMHLWDQISEQAKALKQFVTHVASEVKTLIENFDTLDPDLILNMACHAGGEILVGGLISGGVLGIVGKIGLALTKAALKIKSLKNVFDKLSNLKKAGRIDLANGILSCEM